MRTFNINEQKYTISLNDEQYYMFLGLKNLFKKNIINESELFECLKIADLEICDLNVKPFIKKQSILKEILLFYNHKHQSSLDKIIKILKSIIAFNIPGFETIENLYIENNKNITMYNYFFNNIIYNHHKYEEYKIICLLHEYMEKIDINTLLFILGYFIIFYKTI
jgi:hypothetical protein